MNRPLLLIIASAACASTLLGGALALKLSDRLHVILGFSAGAVIGVAFFDLLPEALAFDAAALRPAALTVSFAALGFLLYLVIDRVSRFHGDAGLRGAFAAAVLCVHSLLDGIALGLAFATSRAVGLIVAIAVLAHDFSDGINTTNVVLRGGGSRRKAVYWLLLDALAPLAGALLSLTLHLDASAFGTALALFAGFFLYIGASDLIPESYHAHPKFLTTAMTLAGAAVLYFAIDLIGR